MKNTEQVKKHAESLSRTLRTLSLQNDFINQIPAPDKISKDELLFRYSYLYKALDNLFELNQHLMDDIDSAAGYLYDLADEQENPNE